MAGDILNKVPNGESNDNNSADTTLTSIETFRQEFGVYTDQAYSHYVNTENYLKSIADALRTNGIGASAASARQSRYDSNSSFRDPYNRRGRSVGGSSSFDPFGGKNIFKDPISDFSKEFKKELFDSLVGSKLKSTLQVGLNRFAKDLGTTVSDLPKTLARNLAGRVKDSKLGKDITDKVNQFTNNAINSLAGSYNKYSKNGMPAGRAFFSGMQEGRDRAKGAYRAFRQGSGTSSAFGAFTRGGGFGDIGRAFKSAVKGDYVGAYDTIQGSQGIRGAAGAFRRNNGLNNALNSYGVGLEPTFLNRDTSFSGETILDGTASNVANSGVGNAIGSDISGMSELSIIADAMANIEQAAIIYINNNGGKVTKSVENTADQPVSEGEDKTSDIVRKEAQKAANKSLNSSDSNLPDISNMTENTEATQVAEGGANVGAESSLAEGMGSTAAEGAMASEGSTALVASEGGGAMTAAGGMAEAGSAASGFAGALGSAIPQILIIIAIIKAVQIGMKLLQGATQELTEGWNSMKESLKKSAMRDIETRKKEKDAAKQRIKDDMETLIKEPFNILKSAAEEIYSAWDSQLRTITATQGYNKSDLQDLMAVYAQRLRDDGLTKVVSGADITENLSKVLESGLSGQVAEEFAYLATKLNAAIPTQDFFSYGETYATLAANAMAQGKSQSEAISMANKQLETFASSVLYASRELTGGFSTGLKDASDLFTKSVQITQAAKTGDASNVAGVLTAVAGITGALAPDLASTMVDSIVKAATGGNSSEIVALRSLAGVNASNTEFLKLLASDPQKIFNTLFTNLAKMQNMSNDAFMEVAEGLSSVFGVSMDAFARLDFNQLATAIANMNTSDESLNQNMKLLVSGQTTTTQEQLKMQQINQYMIEEGLSFVVDNAAARMIQEHMWQEQQTRAITEAEYGVDIIGGALDLFTGIYNFIDKIIMILNPFYGLFKVVSNIIKSGAEAAGQRADVGNLLRAGEVKANSALSASSMRSYGWLTTTGSDLHITPHLLELMGGSSAYKNASTGLGVVNGVLGAGFGLGPALMSLSSMPTMGTSVSSGGVQSPSSTYHWGRISKSVATIMAGSGVPSGMSLGGTFASPMSATANQSATAAATSALKSKLDKMLEDEYMKGFIGEDKGGYSEWQKSARSFGISNLEEAIKSAGYNEDEIKEKFEQQQAQEQSRAKLEREHREEAFWDDNIQYHKDMLKLMTDIWGTDKKTISDIYSKTSDIFDKTKDFMDAWVDYFVNHTAYKESYDYTTVSKILDKEKRGTTDAIQALADALIESKNLEDPQIQTNVLLAQILQTVMSILAKESGSMKFSLADTLSALGLGGLTE